MVLRKILITMMFLFPSAVFAEDMGDVIEAPEVVVIGDAADVADEGDASDQEKPEAAGKDTKEDESVDKAEEAPAEEEAKETVTGAAAESATEDKMAEVPTTDEAAGNMVGQIIDAAQNGQWTVLGGLCILLMIWLFNRLGMAAKIGRKAVPWASLGLGALALAAAALAAGEGVVDALQAGVFQGGAAVALWELLFKNLTSTKTDGTPRDGEEEE